MEHLTELLEALANKLGTTVDHLWGVIVQQAHVYVFKFMFLVGCFVFFTILSVFIIRYVLKLKKSWDSDYPFDETGWPFLAWISELIPAGILIGIFACLGTFITVLINPEYWALQKILSQLKLLGS